MSLAEIYLKKHEDKRLRQGHLWVFSNEIDTQRSPLDNYEPGDLVHVLSHDGKNMGSAYINPNTLICARLLTRKANLNFGKKFLKDRLSVAMALRETLFQKPYYRLAFGESDGLPGLVIDRFGSVLSVQINTVGIERRKELLLEALNELISPSAVVFKNDNQQRELEGLSTESALGYGQLPEELTIEENGARFIVDIFGGQKTGWFYDHRNSRAKVANFAKGKSVLDLFSYTGAWAIPTAMAGASAVDCVDASESAINLAQKNAQINGCEGNMSFTKLDVFDYLKDARQQGKHWDIIILDPPALIKRKKDFKQGYEAYRRLNQLALQVLAKNGILVSASCSHHLSMDNLHEILRSSARHIDRHLIFFDQGGQAGDHPIDPAIPETHYLKTCFCAVSASL